MLIYFTHIRLDDGFLHNQGKTTAVFLCGKIFKDEKNQYLKLSGVCSRGKQEGLFKDTIQIRPIKRRRGKRISVFLEVAKRRQFCAILKRVNLHHTSSSYIDSYEQATKISIHVFHIL